MTLSPRLRIPAIKALLAPVLLAPAILATPALLATPAAADGNLPDGFVYLQDVDPTIVQEMRYYGRHNFVGRRVAGYNAPECVLTKRAARALSKLQKRLRRRSLSLKVYDCYRPVRGVQHFVRWARNIRDRRTKGEFYPTIDKRILFKSGFISSRSAHSRGSTVDLTIVPVKRKRQPEFDVNAQVACHLPASQRFQDNSIDMGTGYDCFHAYSSTRHPAIKGEARINRRLLVDGMRQVGFRNYSKEWWHYTLNNEPFRRTFFDFVIQPHPSNAAASLPASKPLDPTPVRPVRNPKLNRTGLNGSGQDGSAGDGTSLDKAGLDKAGLDDKLSELASATPAPTERNVDTATEGDGRIFRFVCPNSDATHRLWLVPSRDADTVEQMPSHGGTLLGFQCEGEVSLERWHSLDATDQRIIAAPLCLIQENALLAATGSANFWIDGAKIYPSASPAPRCRE